MKFATAGVTYARFRRPSAIHFAGRIFLQFVRIVILRALVFFTVRIFKFRPWYVPLMAIAAYLYLA